MINYQYTETPYVDPINLEILSKTYDTLEEGHHKALEAESKLKTEIANLDLNEAEDGFKQELLNDLNATIEANTRYGNKYSALDDIIRESGNIASNPALIGRIKAQQDYTAFMKSLDEAKIPDNYKEMYRDLNPYYYQDKEDESGNIIGGTKWQAKHIPVDSVDRWKLIQEGIKIAAKNVGGTTTVQYVDDNNQITDDISKASKTNYYSTVTNTWEELPQDKIQAGIQAAIENTSGAKASIEQDYKFAVWEYRKLQNEEDGAVISELTDDNGNILSVQQYLEKKLSPAVFAATYRNEMQTITHGGGGSAYRRASGNARINSQMQPIQSSSVSTPLTYHRDEAVRYNVNKNSAIDDITKIVRKYNGDNYVFNVPRGELITDDTFKNVLENPDLTNEDKMMLITQSKIYNEAVINMNNMRRGVKKEDLGVFDLAVRLESGEGLINSKNGGTKLDDFFINNLNYLANENGDIVIKFDDGGSKNGHIREIFYNMLGKTYKEDLKRMGVVITDDGFTIPKDARSSAPMILNTLMVAQDKRNLGFTNTALSLAIEYNFTVTSASSKLETIDLGGDRGVAVIGATDNEDVVKDISNKYKYVQFQKEKIDKTTPSFNTKITRSTNMFEGMSYADAKLREELNLGLITPTDYNARMEMIKSDFQRQLKNQEFSQLQIYGLIEGDKSNMSNTMTEVEKSEDRHRLGQRIQTAILNDKAELVPAMVSGLVDENGIPYAGYIVKIWDNKKDDQGNISRIKEETYYIPQLKVESGTEYFREHPRTRADSTVTNLGETRTYNDLTIGNNLENCSITGNDVNSFDIKFNDVEIKDVSSLTATEYLTCLNYFENLSLYAKLNGGLDDKQGHGEILNYVAGSLAKIFTQPIDNVKDYLTNKILSNMSNE